MNLGGQIQNFAMGKERIGALEREWIETPVGWDEDEKRVNRTNGIVKMNWIESPGRRCDPSCEGEEVIRVFEGKRRWLEFS